MERMQFVLFIMASGSGSECRNDQSKKKTNHCMNQVQVFLQLLC